MAVKAARLAGQVAEDLLGDVLGEMGIAADLAARGRIHEIEPTVHQFRESPFGVVFGVAAEEFGVGHGPRWGLAPAAFAIRREIL